MRVLRNWQTKKQIFIFKIIFKEDSMSERKDSNNGHRQGQNKNGSVHRVFSLPPTSSKPPMPPVKPPKKK